MTSSTARAEPDAIPEPISAAATSVATDPIESVTTKPTAAIATEPTVSASVEPPATVAVPVPQDQAGIDSLRLQIDSIDAELVRLIQQRTAISHAIGTARKSLGGPRIVYSREMAILERFRSLGPAGTDLGMMLLSMGRGRLGRK